MLMWILLSSCTSPPETGDDGTDAVVPPVTDTDTTPPVVDTDVVDTAPPVDTGPLLPEWDTGPPDVEVGEIVRAVITCSLFLEPANAEFVKTEDAWLWDLLMDGGGGLRIPGLEACYQGDGASMVLWIDSQITIITGNGILHLLEPTPLENDWAGTVVPYGDSSPACNDALAEIGLTWPLPIRMTVVFKDEVEE
jgi:hypothetical protein